MATTEETTTKQELITVEQQSILTEHFDDISAQLDNTLQIVSGMVVSEDNYKDAKKIRAEINKDAKGYADAFKQVKASVLDPWNQIEAAYKVKVRDKYAEADRTLKAKINEITDGIKENKTEEVRAFFDEHAKAAGLDWLRYEMMGQRVGMSDSMKSLKDSVTNFIQMVSADVDAINAQPDGPAIMTEYKRNGLQISAAIRTVEDRMEAERREAEARKEREAARQAAAEREKAVKDVIREEAPEMKAPEPEAEKRLSATFTAIGTKEQLKALVHFMRAQNIEFTQN